MNDEPVAVVFLGRRRRFGFECVGFERIGRIDRSIGNVVDFVFERIDRLVGRGGFLRLLNRGFEEILLGRLGFKGGAVVVFAFEIGNHNVRC